MSDEKTPLSRDQMAAILAQHLCTGWVVNLGIGIPTGVSDFLLPEQEITLTSENGVIGYGRVAGLGEEDPYTVNASAVQSVTLNPGASIVHHADSFALIRGGLVDVTCLGAYEAAMDGSFANWKTTNDDWCNLGGIGGAMDLASCAKTIFLAMDHMTRDGKPRLLERCTLPVTAPSGVSLIVTNMAVVAVREGRFILEQHAPGYSVEDIRAVTGAPLDVSPELRQVRV
jgi:3-oxoacid CoA-transferase B subunit